MHSEHLDGGTEFKPFDEFLPAFADKLVDFGGFNQCEIVKIDKVSPEHINKPLERLVYK